MFRLQGSSVRKTEKTPAEGMGSPVPDSLMEAFFYGFTEDHRKILNELVSPESRSSHESGSFDLMVRNSKVLEFDNKRNYFHTASCIRAPTSRVTPTANCR